MEKTSKKVQDIFKRYREQPVEILPGLKRDTYEIIKRVYFYRNDKYVQCSDPNAIFWQVVTPYIPHFSKLIDLDPKDLRPVGIGDVNFYQAWILRRKLQAWIEDNNFGVQIDDLTKLVSAFGSYVWKWNEAEEEIEPCDLRNIAFDPTTETIRESDVAEYHYLSDSEIREMDWKDTDKIVENAVKQDGTNKKEIWEFWGEVEYKDKKFKYVHQIGAGYGDKEVIAFEEDSDPEDSPYYDFHLDEYKGTWLRVGAYEKCFPEQERANTIVNENAQATSIASLLLLRSSDPNTQGNVLQEAISGQIITSSDLQQIGIDNRAFTILLKELETIQTQVQKKLMLPDIATGDNMPSGTPFRGMAVMSNAYKSAFKQIRTRVASGVVDVMLERIMPTLVKTWNKGELMEIAEDASDIQLYDKAVETVAKMNVYGRANETGAILPADTDSEIKRLIDESTKVNGRKVNLPKGFFNFKYGLFLDPVGETFDKAQQNDAIVQALTLTMQNPAISEIPAFKQLLENNGVSPFKLTKAEQSQMMQASQPPQPGMISDMLGKMTQPVDTTTA